MKLKKIVVLFLLAMQTPLLAMNHGPIPEERMPRLLILGKTGAGKSTMINALYNLAIGTQAGDFPKKFPIRTEFQACNVPQYADSQAENLASTTESTTMDPIEYIAQGNGFVLKMIDTPGAADTRDVNWDRRNNQKIADFVERRGSFNAICIVLKNTANRISVEELYLFEQIKSVIPRGAYNRIFFLISNAFTEGPNIESFIRGVGLPIDNIFYFENLAMTRVGHIDFNAATNAAGELNRRNGPNRIASIVRESWADSQAEFEELKNKAIALGPYSSNEMQRIGRVMRDANPKIRMAANLMLTLEGSEDGLESLRRALQIATIELNQAYTNDARARAEREYALADQLNFCTAAFDNCRREVEQFTNDVARLYVELGQVSMGSIDFHIGEYYDVLIRKEGDNRNKAQLTYDRQFYLEVVHRMQGQRANRR
jgi:energy-coupling factor transporter ATP-binding protein EcfA2